MHTHTHPNSHQPSLVFRFVSAAWVLLPACVLVWFIVWFAIRSGRILLIHCVIERLQKQIEWLELYRL